MLSATPADVRIRVHTQTNSLCDVEPASVARLDDLPHVLPLRRPGVDSGRLVVSQYYRGTRGRNVASCDHDGGNVACREIALISLEY